MDVVATGHPGGADDPGRAVAADADVGGPAGQCGPALAAPAEDRAGIVDYPGVALAIHVDAHATGAHVAPALAIPAPHAGAAGDAVVAYFPEGAVAAATDADVGGRTGHEAPLAGGGWRGRRHVGRPSGGAAPAPGAFLRAVLAMVILR